MKFTLGTETVNPINDGGLRIRHKIGKEQTDFQLRGVRPVLSLEAKRRKSKRRNDPDLPWDFAGQIFAEMLGQVCYEDFYKNPAMDYHEVSLYPPPTNLTHRHSLCMGVVHQSRSTIANIDYFITPRGLVERLNLFILEHENECWNKLAGRILTHPEVSPAICLSIGCSGSAVVFPLCPNCCRRKFNLEVRPSTLSVAGLGLFTCGTFNEGDYVSDYCYDMFPNRRGIVLSVSLSLC